MTHYHSAIKRARKSLRRKARAKLIKGNMRSAVRKLKGLIQGGGAAEAAKGSRLAVSAVDKAVAKGAVKRKTASRIISRMAKNLDKLAKAKVE